jgi:FAD-dependent urate hydroxylase
MRGAGVRILVVGAGIAGLAAARTLHEWGAIVEIVERTPSPTVLGTGIYLPGNAVRALSALDLAQPVAARAVTIERQRVADHRGRLLFEFEVDEVWQDVGPSLAIHRSDLHQILLAGAKAVPIRWGCSPRGIADTAADVRVEFTDGTRGSYDLVIGADGVHSMTRKLVFGGGAVPRPVGQFARRFVAAWPDAEPVWSLMMGRRSVFLTIPIGDGRVYCYCDGPLVASPPPLRELLAGYAEPVPHLIGLAGEPHSAPIEEVTLPRWSRGAVLLIGDAAHATSPNMAEGAAMALEDAIVLADSLAEARSLTEALHAYEARRRVRTGWVLAQTHRRDRTRNVPPALRRAVLKRFGRQIFHRGYEQLRSQP